MTISKNWMEMTPKKETRLVRLKCYLCGKETEVFSDEIYRVRKCSSCRKEIDPVRCEFVQAH